MERLFQNELQRLVSNRSILTADAVTAEVALAKSIEDFDISNSPGQTGLAAWERAMVMRSIEAARVPPRYQTL